MASFPKGNLLNHWSAVNACLKCRRSSTQFPTSSIRFGSYKVKQFSSKTPINKSTMPAVATTQAPATAPPPPKPATAITKPEITVPESLPVFSGVDIREVDEATRLQLHKASQAVAEAQSYSLSHSLNPRHRQEILIMEEKEYKGSLILKNRPPLLDRLGETESFFEINKHIDQKNRTDQMVFLQQDIDIRPAAIQRVLDYYKRKLAIRNQEYNPKRNRILGNDLAIAHMIVANGGRVKFLGQDNWISTYRKDAKEGVPEEDLPVMKFELCTLPTKYDPRFRVEALDLNKFELYFEGLVNFENINYLKWLSLRDQPHVDDWCLDRIARLFHESLEYIDVSGCKLVTDRGIGTLHRCRNLKAIRVENMPHLENLEIVSALLEEHNPNLQVIGIDYEGKMEQMRLEGDELSRKVLEQKEDAQIAIDNKDKDKIKLSSSSTDSKNPGTEFA